jgi:very-short-patch-repair endonuclease
MRGPIVTFKLARRLRRDMSLPEIVLWRAMRGKQLSMRFRKQHPVGPYVLDLYCPEAQLAVEVDGFVHDLPEQAAHDERRDAWLAKQGIRVLRFAAADVLNDRELSGVLARIEAVGRGEA